MNSHTESKIAEFMLEQLRKEEVLYQESAVEEIQKIFGGEFVYTNENGNLAINRKVLSEFRKLTEGIVVWDRSDRYWRFIEDYDDPNSRTAE